MVTLSEIELLIEKLTYEYNVQSWNRDPTVLMEAANMLNQLKVNEMVYKSRITNNLYKLVGDTVLASSDEGTNWIKTTVTCNEVIHNSNFIKI